MEKRYITSNIPLYGEYILPDNVFDELDEFREGDDDGSEDGEDDDASKLLEGSEFQESDTEVKMDGQVPNFNKQNNSKDIIFRIFVDYYNNLLNHYEELKTEINKTDNDVLIEVKINEIKENIPSLEVHMREHVKQNDDDNDSGSNGIARLIFQAKVKKMSEKTLFLLTNGK